MKRSQRQRIRKSILLVMVFLFPIVFYYLSPYLIIAGGSEGIIVGSFISFLGMFIGSLFLGRVFCGWLCPGGATQELTMKVNSKNYNGKKRNWIKFFIWAPWITIVAIVLIQSGGIRAVDPFYQTYYGISISDITSAITFLVFFGIIAGVSLAAGKRAFCHSGCWMAPFMIIGRKIRNIGKWPALQLTADKNQCTNCRTCTKGCPMSLDVNAMVQNESMENSECILCGTCADNCPKSAISLSFGTKK
ncbi:MAG TPA: 4Fe-4S binding protein [Candidatus Bathyarchaeia archaeon]